MCIQAPNPQQQLNFLKNIQKVLHIGHFSSTYKLHYSSV